MPSLSENAWKDLKLFRDCRSRSINRKTIFHGVSTKFLNRAEPRRACQYRLLFSPKYRAKPGPIGPDQDLIRAVVDMKQRIRLRTAEDLPGSLSSVMRKIVFIALICSDVSRWALRTFWVLVVMDQYTRRIIGFGVQLGIVNRVALCRMFNRAIRGTALPKYLT